MKRRNHLKIRDDYRVCILAEDSEASSPLPLPPEFLNELTITFSDTLPPPCNWDIAVLPVSGISVWAPVIQIYPVICTGAPEHIQDAYAAGCIDYLTTGFSPDELYYRIRKYLETLEKEEIRIPPSLERALNYQERVILELLLANFGEPVHRKALQLYLWGEIRPGSRGIDMHITALRRIFRQLLPRNQMLTIKTVHGCGYLVNNLNMR